jgi:hypothetical protein
MQQVTDRRNAGPRVPTAVFIAVIGGAVVLMLVAVVMVATLVLRRTSPADSVPATLAVTLTRTSTGTEVDLVINSVGADLPDRMDLQLTPRDQGINDDGGPFTDAAIGYRQVRDRAGGELSIGDPPTTIKDVPTDGRRAELAFSVASAGDRRVIYPLPYSSALRFNAITVNGAATTSCLQSSGSENGRLHYFTCSVDPSGSLRYSGGRWAPESIRLELAG